MVFSRAYWPCRFAPLWMLKVATRRVRDVSGVDEAWYPKVPASAMRTTASATPAGRRIRMCTSERPSTLGPYLDYPVHVSGNDILRRIGPEAQIAIEQHVAAHAVHPVAGPAAVAQADPGREPNRRTAVANEDRGDGDLQPVEQVGLEE